MKGGVSAFPESGRKSHLAERAIKSNSPHFLPLACKMFSCHNRKHSRQSLSDGVCLYGEGYGAKIQKGRRNYRQDQDFVSIRDILL